MTRPRLVDTETAAAALCITPAGVRKLAERGVLTRYGTSRRRLYDLWECRDLTTRRRVA